jgi:hypothetical protein
MNLTATHSNHMNIVDSRKRAVKFLTKRTGITVYSDSNRVPKARMISAIKKGLFDGYYYSHNKDKGMITLTLHSPFGYTPNKIGH